MSQWFAHETCHCNVSLQEVLQNVEEGLEVFIAIFYLWLLGHYKAYNVQSKLVALDKVNREGPVTVVCPKRCTSYVAEVMEMMK